MTDPMGKLTRLAEVSLPLAKKLAIMRLKPELEPQLRKTGLEWADVVPALETIDSVEELKDAMADPMGKLTRMAEASVPLAKKLAIMRLKPELEPQLHEQGLEWADVVPALETIDSVEELKDAMADPMSKLTEMAEASVPLAKKLAIMRLKPELEAYLRKTGLEWADVVPVLETIDSIEELKDAMADPMGKLTKMAEASVPLAKKLAIMRLKPELEPQLRKTRLEWADVVPVLEAVDSIEELKDAMVEPQAFLARLVKASGSAGKKLAIMRPKPKPELQLHKTGL
jgi:predicted protein tyrosine phosphatase